MKTMSAILIADCLMLTANLHSFYRGVGVLGLCIVRANCVRPKTILILGERN